MNEQPPSEMIVELYGRCPLPEWLRSPAGARSQGGQIRSSRRPRRDASTSVPVAEAAPQIPKRLRRVLSYARRAACRAHRARVPISAQDDGSAATFVAVAASGRFVFGQPWPQPWRTRTKWKYPLQDSNL